MFGSIRRWLPLSYAAIALLAALVLGAVLLTTLRGYYVQRELDYMTGNARAMDDTVARLIALDPAPAALESQLRSMAFLSQTRVRLLDEGGQVVADSGDPRERYEVVMLSMVESPSFRQTMTQTIGSDHFQSVIAIQDALSGARTVERVVITTTASPGAPWWIVRGESLRGEEGLWDEPGLVSQMPAVGTPFGFGLGAETALDDRRSSQVVSRPIYDPEGRPLGRIELSEGPAYGRRILESVAWGWGIASGVAVLLAAGAGWFVSLQITHPLSSLTRVTARMAQGDLSARAQIRRRDELGMLARSFDEMAGQVQETVSTLRRFVADAAHELHTPLTALRTHLELAPDDEHVARAQGQVARLEALTEGLLSLSRIEAEKRIPASASLALDVVVQEVAELYASQAEQAGLAFDLRVAERPLVVAADAAQVRDALGNLLDNAVKFTPPGGTVSVCVDREGEWAAVRVQDTGIGIPPEDLPHLFRRFHRGRNAAAYPGSGLGLAIVRAIVERYSGTVEAETVEQGTRFTLRLPVR